MADESKRRSTKPSRDGQEFPRRGLLEHPTVKPYAMLDDALLDLTNRGEIVIDPFSAVERE
jgi:DNA modification methylase